MRGSIRKRNGSYQVRWHVGEGKYKAKSFKRKKDADRFLSEVVGQVHDGSYRDIKPTTFKEFADLWLETHSMNLRPSTTACYKGILENHLIPFFTSTPLTAIGPDDIIRLLGKKKESLSPATRNKLYNILSRLFSDAKKWRYLRQSPIEGVDPPKVFHKEMKYLTPEEADKFLETVNETDPDYFCLFQTALQTGLRLGELLALKWSDIDFEAGVIRVCRQNHKGTISEPKSKRSIRPVPVPKALEKTLREHRLACPPCSEGWVFPSQTGTPLNDRNMVRRHFEPALKAASLERIRFHDLRHSYAAHLVAAGVHAKAIQEALGHSSIKTTLDRYGHLMPSAFSQVAEALDALHKKA